MTWRDQARCRDDDPDVWWSTEPHDIAYAKAICGSCPVRGECAVEAYEQSREGRAGSIWAGLRFDPQTGLATR